MQKHNIIPTKKSLSLTREISDNIDNKTFHHHYHILYDIPFVDKDKPVYLEIGCYAGGSSILMLSRPNTTVISIDTGTVIPQSVVQENVSKCTTNTNFHYIEANSQIKSTVEKVKQIADKIDILFIDGDHSYKGSVTDWNLYCTLVKPGGYIIFDDYNCPESLGVKKAVDLITNQKLFPQYYAAIGTIPNTLGARGFADDYKEGNCFIIQKLK